MNTMSSENIQLDSCSDVNLGDISRQSDRSRVPLKELNNVVSIPSCSTSQNVSLDISSKSQDVSSTPQDDLQISRVPVVPRPAETEESVTSTMSTDINIPTASTDDSLGELKEALKSLESCSNVAFKSIEKRASSSKAMEKDKSNSTKDLMLLHANLKDYQKRGVQWMWSVYYNGCEGAILGDEMGLGKTVQLIAVLCKVIEEEVTEPNLIVCPLSVLNNWEAEFKKFAPQIQIIKYYGTKEERNVLKKKLLQPGVEVECTNSAPGPEKSKSSVKLRLPHIIVTTPQLIDNDYNFLKKQEWNCIVVDEGHSVKNSKTNLSKKLSSMKSIFKVLLTGTPLQNNLKELWSLLKFVQPSNTFEFDKFEKLVAGKLSSLTAENIDDVTEASVDPGVVDILDTLHNILKPFFLRRTKQDVDLNLPPKKTVVIDCPLVPGQKAMYTNILTRTLKLNMNQVDFSVESDWTENDTDLSLVNDTLNQNDESLSMSTSFSSSSDTSAENLSVVSGKRSRDCLDLDDSTPGQSRKRRKCTENVLKQQKTIADLENCPSSDEEGLEELYRSVNCNAEGTPGLPPPPNPDEIKYKLNYRLTNVTMCLRKIINHPYLVRKPYKVINGMKEMVVDEKIIKSCGKMIVLNQLLAKLKETKHKVLVFSTMTKALDMIEEMCIMKDFNYYRLDGRVKNESRNQSIDDFNNSDVWSVFLISTRAGGLGLNLVGADTCINYDSDWNPQVDCQAEARCHRIGQTKPVCIYRLVAQNTLDELIYETAQSKLRLGHIVLPDHLFKFEATAKDQQFIDVRELLRQIRMKTKGSRVHPDGNIYTDTEIENFLDRSDLL
ncbi:hypothetical protein WDU94_009303 [Cyamophila willieti]